MKPMNMPDKEWREKLTPEQYAILREKGTEPPFTGQLLHNKDKGTYVCAACKQPLFSSEHKFDSGSGWPSFYDVTLSDAVELHRDSTHGMERTEVTCKNCGGHLGHVFDDAYDQPTGKRYCINSISLDFKHEHEA
jgi:peptide-methionine (R)-S-oxide reductase